MFGLLLLAAFLGFILLIPLMILGFVLRLVFAIVLLPLKLAGLALKLTFGLVAGLIGVVVGGIALFVTCLILGTVLLIPLLPAVFAVAAIWLIWRLARRKPQVVPSTY